MHGITQDRGSKGGKIDERKRKMYGDTDLSNLDYLEHRDITRIAEELKKENKLITPSYVSKVKCFTLKNTKIMAELLKKGGERRRTLTTATN